MLGVFRVVTDPLTLAVPVVLGELEARSALAGDASFWSFSADMSAAVVLVHAGRAFLCPIYAHCRNRHKCLRQMGEVFIQIKSPLCI